MVSVNIDLIHSIGKEKSQLIFNPLTKDSGLAHNCILHFLLSHGDSFYFMKAMVICIYLYLKYLYLSFSVASLS